MIAELVKKDSSCQNEAMLDDINKAINAELQKATEEAHYRFTSLRVAVVAMRDAQRSYFSTRGKTQLDRSKYLEKRVDDLLAQK